VGDGSIRRSAGVGFRAGGLGVRSVHAGSVHAEMV
jgi:hypothetical protein